MGINASTQLNKRIMMVGLVIVIIALIIIGNAFTTQVVEGKSNLVLANSNARSSEIIRAPRGLIYDVNGRQLVNNNATFNVYAIPGEVGQKKYEATIAEVARLFKADKAQLLERYKARAFNAKGEPVGERITLLFNIKYEDFLANAETIEKLAGIYISSETKRNYVDAQYLAHVVGYLGDINAEEVKELGLDQKARVGKDGLEKIYDKQLRGEDGVKISQRSVNNDADAWVPKSYKYGDNIYLSIDLQWQKSLYDYLDKYAKENNSLGASAVIVEADTGKVKAMVNYPTYDLNAFADGISVSEFNKLINDDQSPLLNRAIAMQIPTGSIFKVVMASALQQEQVINKNTVYKSGCFELPGGYKLCEADRRNYGSLNMTGALARSSNPYFCQASVDMAKKLGSDELAIRSLNKYFTEFGLGAKTGIDLPGEQPGTMPTPELKLRLQGEPWYLADLCNTAIGQGLVSATPMQMVMSMAAVTNGGYLYEPTLVDRFEDANLRISKQQKQNKGRVGIDEQYFANIREGMRGAVEYGSATGLRGIPGSPIAKTGSSEAKVRTASGRLIDGAHSWVLGSFEYHGKQYSFVVAQQFGGRGYKSVPVAADFIDCLYKNFDSCR